MFDFNKQKCIFEGKHHYHWLGHKFDIIINDIDWAKKSVNPYLIAAVTSQSELKLYDVRANKSMLAQKIGDYALNKVMIKSKKKVLIGDANSNLWEFDYKKSSKFRGYVYRRYRGFVGGINDFAVHPTRNLVASVGLGRYVVVHRFNQPHLPMFRTYLKQKLNAVLFGEKWDTKYMPEEEEKTKEDESGDKNENEQKEDDVDGFLDDDDESGQESEGSEGPKSEESDHDSLDIDRLDPEELKEIKDAYGYDTDELEELLEELKASKQTDDEIETPPLKKRKLSEK